MSEYDEALDNLTRRAEQAERAAEHWQRIAEQRRATYQRLRDHPAVVLLVLITDRLLPPTRRFGALLFSPARAVWSTLRWLIRIPARAGCAERFRHLTKAIARLDDPPDDPRRVSLLVVARDNREPLERLLASLKTSTSHRKVELVVVDNASAAPTRHWLAGLEGITLVRNDHQDPYSTALSRAVEVATGEVYILLDPDIEVLTGQWVRRLLAHLDETTAAVGAILINPRRPLSSRTVQIDGHANHLQLEVAPTPDTPFSLRPRTGPLPTPTTERRLVPAASGALLAIRADAYQTCGPFSAGELADAIDADWCLNARQHGWQLAVAHDVIAAYDTQVRTHTLTSKGTRRLARRHGPHIARQVLIDQLTSSNTWTSDPLTATVIVDHADQRPAADTLIAALSDHGWDVTRSTVRKPHTDRTVTISLTPRWLPSDSGHPGHTQVALVTDQRTWTTSALDRYDMVCSHNVRNVETVADTYHQNHVLDPDEPATSLIRLLVARARRAQFVLKVGNDVDTGNALDHDTGLAVGLARALRAAGHSAWVAHQPRWDHHEQLQADVAIQLRGTGVAHRAPAQLDILWVVSHPDEITRAELDSADLVLAGSRRYASWVAERSSTPVAVLYAATDPHRFHQRDPVARYQHPLVFFGPAQPDRQPAVDAARDAGLDVVVYGSNWDDKLSVRQLAGHRLSYDELAVAYSSCTVVLTDHRDDARRWGLLNRGLFDALACGSCIVSDTNPEIRETFGATIATFADADELAHATATLADDETLRVEMGRRGQRHVLTNHTFNRRASQLLGLLAPVLETHRRGRCSDSRPALAATDTDGRPYETR